MTRGVNDGEISNRKNSTLMPIVWCKENADATQQRNVLLIGVIAILGGSSFPGKCERSESQSIQLWYIGEGRFHAVDMHWKSAVLMAMQINACLYLDDMYGTAVVGGRMDCFRSVLVLPDIEELGDTCFRFRS